MSSALRIMGLVILAVGGCGLSVMSFPDISQMSANRSSNAFESDLYVIGILVFTLTAAIFGVGGLWKMWSSRRVRETV